jgi:hypothetical protein
MHRGSRFYLPRYNLPIHTATLPCHPGHGGVPPLCTMAQACRIASRICSLLVSTGAGGRCLTAGMTSHERDMGSGRSHVFPSSRLRVSATSRTFVNSPPVIMKSFHHHGEKTSGRFSRQLCMPHGATTASTVCPDGGSAEGGTSISTQCRPRVIFNGGSHFLSRWRRGKPTVSQSMLDCRRVTLSTASVGWKITGVGWPRRGICRDEARMTTGRRCPSR